MHLLGFKGKIIGWLVFYVAIGFLPLAFTEKVVHPFLLTPAADVEKYNYAANIIECVKPLILIGVMYALVVHYSKVNIDERLNKWIRKSTKDIIRIIVVLIIYHVKELFDYLTYENTIPECLDHVWFLIIWELLPVFLLLFWALIPINPLKKNGSA